MAGSPPDQKVNVIRRVGGLEVPAHHAAHQVPVIRRVGGLEEIVCTSSGKDEVIRRVGGLEVISFWSKVSSSDMLPPNVHAESKYPR